MSVETASDDSTFLDSHLATSTYISLVRTVSCVCPKPQRKLAVISYVLQEVSIDAEIVRSEKGLMGSDTVKEAGSQTGQGEPAFTDANLTVSASLVRVRVAR